MTSGKVSIHTHITTSDIRRIAKFKHLTEPEAARLLQQIQEFSNLIYHQVTQKENE